MDALLGTSGQLHAALTCTVWSHQHRYTRVQLAGIHRVVVCTLTLMPVGGITLAGINVHAQCSLLLRFFQNKHGDALRTFRN